MITFDVKSGGSDQLPLIPCRYSRAAVADHELYTGHARGDAQVGCCYSLPAKATSTPAIAKYVLLPNSSVVERDGWRAVDHHLREGCTGTASTFLCFWHECVFAFNAQLATKIICKGRAQRIHFRKISTTGQGEL